MGFTSTTLPVVHAQPTRVARAVLHPRRVEITVTGAAPVWLGDDSVQAGRGRQLQPGDDPFVYGDTVDLYAISWSPTTVDVWEQA